MAFGETLNDRFRGPNGAEGGGVCPRAGALKAAIPPPTSDRGEAKAGRGEMEAWPGDIREARGPVGAASSPIRPPDWAGEDGRAAFDKLGKDIAGDGPRCEAMEGFGEGCELAVSSGASG